MESATLDFGRFETTWRGAGPEAEWTLCGSAYAKHIPTDRAVATRAAPSGPECPECPECPERIFIERVTLTELTE